MGSAATVDPPEGFQLDEPNAMVGRRGKRVPGPLDEDFEVDPVRITAGAFGDVARGVGNAMSHIYGKIDEAQKDMRLPSQMDTHDLGERAMLAPQVMMPAFARAAGGVVEGIGAAGARAARNPWTSEMVNHLRALDETFTGKPYANSHIIENFRELHPEYTGTDATIQTMIYRRRNTGVNTDTGAIKSSESSTKNPGEIELGAMGGRGSAQPPQITAMRDALMGDEEFEALASKIRDKLEATHAETIGPSHTTYSQSAPRKEDVIRGVKLTYPTSPERLQEIADHAAAWQIYNKRVGGQDFELGAMGARPAARYAQQLSPQQMQEMRQLIQQHPQHAEEIRASYGLGMDEAAGPSISATTQGKSTSRALRNEQNAQSSRLSPSTLPENPPMNTGPVAGGSRALSEDMIAEARKRLASGESVQSVADDFAVHHTTLRDRLERPYSTRTQDEAYRASPRASPLNDDGIRQLILTMKRSGETDANIAHTLRGHMPDEKITTNMVTSQIARMRQRRELEAAGLPVPPELRESNDWKAEVQEGDPGRFAKPRPMPNAMVAPQTRELSGRVSGATDAIDADFPETHTTTRRKTMPGLPPGFVLDDANPNAMVPR